MIVSMDVCILVLVGYPYLSLRKCNPIFNTRVPNLSLAVHYPPNLLVSFTKFTITYLYYFSRSTYTVGGYLGT
eukprot:SAG11_NODE_13814_length_638_cov_0.831169_1_plen_72_part_10